VDQLIKIVLHPPVELARIFGKFASKFPKTPFYVPKGHEQGWCRMMAHSEVE
jgi:hypothetical protein